MRRMPDIAAVEIDRLRDEGYSLTDDEIVWLASLGEKVENPGGVTAEVTGIIDGIRMSDGTVLYPLTMRAEDWLNIYGYSFRGDMEIKAVAYTAANPDKLDRTLSARQAVKRVKQWVKNLRVAPDELTRAVTAIIGGGDAPQQKDAPHIDRETLIGFLVAGTGLPRSHWVNQSWVHINNAHAGIMKYAAMIAGVEYDPDKEAGKRALADLSRAVIEIRRKRQDA